MPSTTRPPRHRRGLPIANNGLRFILTAAAIFCCNSVGKSATFRRIEPGETYRVAVKSSLTGWRLMVDPNDKEKEKHIKLSGQGDVVFRERALGDAAVPSARLLRAYDEVRFQRVVDERQEEATLREDVHRIVLERRQEEMIPYSPDHPLQWVEVELIKQHPVVSALEDFLPGQETAEGDAWTAPESAVLELTGQDSIAEGSLRCEYRGVIEHQGRTLHQIALGGTVEGKVGPQKVRNNIRGAAYLDATTGRTVSFRAMGQQEMLDPSGEKVLGKDEVDYQIVIRFLDDDPELSDAAIASLPEQANERLTTLVFENQQLGIRFYHPRRWGLVPIPGEDILLQSGMSTMVIHLEPEGKTPTAPKYFEDVRKGLEGAKIAATTTSKPREDSNGPNRIGHFQLQAVVQDDPTLLDYWLVERGERGVTLASRIRQDEWEALKDDPEAIIRSVDLFEPQTPPEE